jgi:hypothetical protein
MLPIEYKSKIGLKVKQGEIGGKFMKGRIFALVLLASFAAPNQSSADEGPFTSRTNAVGANCRGNNYFDITATIVDAKVEGTFQGNAFQRGPISFTGVATATSFTASHVFPALGNLRVEISGAKIDADTWTFATKWNGGGASNCESSGQAKKA